jgi:hypothetical protein
MYLLTSSSMPQLLKIASDAENFKVTVRTAAIILDSG